MSDHVLIVKNEKITSCQSLNEFRFEILDII